MGNMKCKMNILLILSIIVIITINIINVIIIIIITIIIIIIIIWGWVGLYYGRLYIQALKFCDKLKCNW